MDTAGAHKQKLKVFISYSRDDQKFADELETGLKLLNYDVFIDRHMSGGEVWKRSLAHHISQADTIVFVLTPSSARSDMCHWEVDEASRLSKRILPVVSRSVADEPVPKKLQELNYIFFTDDISFMDGLTELKDALEKDFDWIQEHTRYNSLAQRWVTGDRDTSQLLTGTGLAEAKAWQKQWSQPNPEPTSQTREYITACEREETNRLSKEHKRTETLQRAVTRTRWALAGALMFAVVAVGAALSTMSALTKAEADRIAAAVAEKTADRARENAEDQTKKAKKLLGLLLGNLKASWPTDDAKSPDYRHLAAAPLGKSRKGKEFLLTPMAIDALISANAFKPTAFDNKIIVALRGAVLVSGVPETNASSISLRDVRPDHDNFRSVFVVYDRKQRILSAFTGSTVPNKKYMRTAFKWHFGAEGQRANLNPTGAFSYAIGPHKAGTIRGVLRQSLAEFESYEIAMRRTFNNLTYDLADLWPPNTVYNNLHMSYFVDKFSSAGALTIRGTYKNHRHSHDFAAFREALGLSATNLKARYGERIDIILLTGLDAAVAASLVANGPDITPHDSALYLTRLRHGSTGERVKKLQVALGISSFGFFGAITTYKLAQLQNKKLKWSDGIYSPEMDDLLGLCVFKDTAC